MLPDEMEAEKNRKIIISLASENETIRKNVKELQVQLQKAYQRIGELNETSNSE